MQESFIIESRARLRTLLAAGYALLITYASLSPFSGWREQGLSFLDVLESPLLQTYTAFDAAINFLSYLPFGLLATLALHARRNATLSVFAGICLGAILSATLEYLQMYLPSRTSSNMDLLSNSMGALIGALLAVSISSWTDIFRRLARRRSILFHHGKEMDFGLALLVLWMFGQINPSLPMLGNVFIRETAHQPFVVLQPAPFNWGECCAVMLNLLMIGSLLLTLLRTPRRTDMMLLAILSIVALAKFATAVLLLKSWALLLWISSEAMLGILLGMLLLLAALRLPRNAVIALGITVAMSYFVIANFTFGNNPPSAARSIYHWHYGHLLNYNGLAQTITSVFPLLLAFHLWRIRKI